MEDFQDNIDMQNHISRFAKIFSISALLIIALLIASLAFVGCVKDSDEVKTNNQIAKIRTGGSSNWKPYFYQNSVSVNSYRTLPTQPIIQLSFKKSEIDTVYMDEYGSKFLLDNNTNLWASFYWVKIQFKDGSANKDQWISEYVGPSYKYKPAGDELYPFPYKTLTINRTSVKEQFVDIEIGKLKTWWKYDVVMDSLYKQQFIKSNNTGTTYLMSHK